MESKEAAIIMQTGTFQPMSGLLNSSYKIVGSSELKKWKRELSLWCEILLPGDMETTSSLIKGGDT